MTRKKPIEPDEKIGLKLTQGQRSLLLDALLPIPQEVKRAIRSTPAHEPLRLSRDDLDDLAGHIADGADHAEDKALRDKLDRIFRMIEKRLGSFADEAPKVEEAPSWFALDLIDLLVGHEPEILTLQSRSSESYEAKPAKVKAEAKLPSKADKGGKSYPLRLTEKQREAAIAATRLRRGLKNKIGQVPKGTQVVEVTRKELVAIAGEVNIAVGFAPAPYKQRLVAVLEKIDHLLSRLD